MSILWGTVACLYQRGPITGYRLRYTNGTSIVNTIGLTPFTSYHVQVAAVNAGGTGPYSNPTFTLKTLEDSKW